MKSRTTEQSRRAFRSLPDLVQVRARQAFRRFQEDPHDPLSHFKQVHPNLPIFSVRVGSSYRALGRRAEGTIVWFWIGSHADYDTLLKYSRKTSE